MSDKDDRRPTWISENLPAEIVTSDLFRFNITFPNGKKLRIDITNDIEVDYENLEDQLDKCPGQYVWYASLYSEAKEMVTLLERRIKIRRGELTDAVLEEARDKNTKGFKFKPTDKQVAAVIEKDEKLNKWELLLARQQKNVGKLWHLVKAVEMKSEHLRSRAGFKKQELQQTT